MSANPIKLTVVDLSHYDEVTSFAQAKAAGLVGVIYKCTEGTSYVDPTYNKVRQMAYDANLLWGAYHFGHSSDIVAQAEWFLLNAKLKEADLFALDYEKSGTAMSALEAKQWLQQTEIKLSRENHGVIYGGDLIKETIKVDPDGFWAAHRLWLAQYTTAPTVPKVWKAYWLWQYSGDGQGPAPHGIAGIQGQQLDCNTYDGTADQLAAEWASGTKAPIPPPSPAPSELVVTITAPPGVTVKVIQE